MKKILAPVLAIVFTFGCLSQVNNGDAVCGWYLNENYLPLHKVEIAG